MVRTERCLPRLAPRPFVRAAGFGLVALLAGCSTIDAINPFGSTAPSATAARQPIPSVTSVPARPEVSPAAERQAVVQGLVADRARAEYTDEVFARPGVVPPGPPPAAPPASVALSPTQPPAPRVDQVPAAPPSTPEGLIASPLAPPPAGTTPRGTQMPEPTPPPGVPRPPGPILPPPGEVGRALGAVPSPPVAEEPRLAALIYWQPSARGLSADDRSVLRQVVDAQRRSGLDIRVVGHASARGTTLDPVRRLSQQLELSSTWADRVVAELVRLGVDRRRIGADAAGASQPQYLESSPAGEAGNRRVEVFLVPRG